MPNFISSIIGLFVGNKLGAARPLGLLIAAAVLEVFALGFSLSGSPLGPTLAAINGFVLLALGCKYNGSFLLCGFFCFLQFFFMIGMSLGGAMAGGYVLANLLCLIYPIAKACL